MPGLKNTPKKSKEKSGSENSPPRLKVDDYYQYNFEKLIRRDGELRALKIVRYHQQLSEDNRQFPNWFGHGCELLATYWEYKQARQTYLHRPCSVFYAFNDYPGRQKYLPVQQIIDLIEGPQFASKTAKLRSLTDEKEKEYYLKDYFSYATLSGNFISRIDSKLVRHSNLICIDIDNQGERLNEIRSIVNTLPITLISFSSPDGTGLRVVCEMNPQILSQEDYYKLYSSILRAACGLPEGEIHAKYFKVSRACYLSHDPEIYVNPLLNL